MITCPECSAPMVLRDSRYGKFYGCSRYPDCTATHGAHPNGRPLGKPGNKATKAARVKAHAVFDRLWKEGRRTRPQAYGWLRAQACVPDHIGEMDEKQCETLIQLVEWEMKVPS